MNHQDWILNSQKALIFKVDPNISTEIISKNDKKLLLVSNVSEESIDKLYFITNTDQNNNYLYIEKFQVYINSSPLSVPIRGLNETVQDVYYNSDITSFLNSQKVHYPFNGLLYQQGCVFRGTTFSEYVDFSSSCTPLSPETSGFEKRYAFIVNPDVTPLYSGGGSSF
jgi:hypothetical protein